MQTLQPLQPTLWRTCRAIANRTRLHLFQALVHQPNQTVGALARRFKLSEPVASQYLRGLEARGLLTVERIGRWVKYRPGPVKNTNTADLVAAMIEVCRREAKAADTLFKLATAFTHPRRIELYCLLHSQSRTGDQLRTAAKMSYWACARHLRKLEDRGLIARQGRQYRVVKPKHELGRQLARMATQSSGMK